MFRRIIQLAVIIALSSSIIDAQTLSNCEPSPPMPPNVKPGISGLTLSRDGKTLVVATGDGKIRFVDLNTDEINRTFTGHTNAVYIANYSPNEKLLASSSRDRTARIWDVATGQVLHTLGGFRCSVKALAFSPDGRTLAASGNDGMLKLWEVKSGKELKSLVHRDLPDSDIPPMRLSLVAMANRSTRVMATAPSAYGTLRLAKKSAIGRRTKITSSRRP